MCDPVQFASSDSIFLVCGENGFLYILKLPNKSLSRCGIKQNITKWGNTVQTKLRIIYKNIDRSNSVCLMERTMDCVRSEVCVLQKRLLRKFHSVRLRSGINDHYILRKQRASIPSTLPHLLSAIQFFLLLKILPNHTKTYRILRYFSLYSHMFQSLAVDYVLYLPQWHRNTPTDTNCGLYLSCSHLRELRRLTENTRPAASYGVSIAVFHFQCPAHEQRDGALRSVASVENQFQFRRHHTH